jgi:transcriptional regulator with XRE-family HTH domain
LFSEVYDEYIAPQMRDLQSESKLRGGRAIKALDMVPRILDDESIPLSERRKWASELESQIRVIVRRMRRDLKLRRKSEQISVRHFQPGANPEVATFESKDILDIPKQPDKFPAVRLKVPKVPTWEQLKKEIARFTAKRGEKAALAAKLGVSRQVLGNWLSSDDQGTPNANLSLKLLDWFYNKMNEPKSSEPAQTSSEPKIRTMKSSYEKHNPNQA